jgi:hypothetical protein
VCVCVCVCVCMCVRPSGERNKLRVYYLSWLRNKILHNDPEVEKKQGWTTVGDMEGCGHYRVGKDVTREWPWKNWGPGLNAGKA